MQLGLVELLAGKRVVVVRDRDLRACTLRPTGFA